MSHTDLLKIIVSRRVTLFKQTKYRAEASKCSEITMLKQGSSPEV